MPHLRPILETGCILLAHQQEKKPYLGLASIEQGGLPEARGDMLDAPISGKHCQGCCQDQPLILSHWENGHRCAGARAVPGKPIPTLVRETTGTRSHPQGYVHTANFSGREQEECGQMAAVGPQAKEQTLALAHNNSNKQSN